MKWEQKDFDFDTHWHYFNAFFFFDKSENRFVPNKFYTEVLHIALDEYLRHRKKLDGNVF